MQSKTLIFIVFIFFSSAGYANNADISIYLGKADILISEENYQTTIEYVDSLLSIDKFFENRKLKNHLIYKKADAYYYLNEYELAFEYYLITAKQEELRPENNLKLISNAYANAAFCLNILGLLEESIVYNGYSYDYAVLINDSLQMVVATSNSGISYKKLGNYKMALQHFEEAYNIDKALNDSIGMAYDLNNMAFFFLKWKKYEQSLKYYKESLKVFKKANMKKQMATRFGNIGQVFYEMNKMMEAERNISKAIIIDKELKDSLSLAKHLGLLGKILLKKGGPQEALKTHFKANEIYLKFKTLELNAISCRLIAECYFELGYSQKAIEWLDKGITIAESNQYYNELINQYELKVNYLITNGRKEEAESYQLKFSLLRESIFSIENSNQVQKLELANELEKKEMKIEKMRLKSIERIKNEKAEKKQSIILIGIIVAFFIVTAYFIIKREQKNSSKLYEQEIEYLQNKIKALLHNNPESLSIKISDINGQLEENLSDREFQILNYIFTKKSNVEIGNELQLSINTIKYHFKNIYKKIGVKNKKEALEFLLSLSS